MTTNRALCVFLCVGVGCVNIFAFSMLPGRNNGYWLLVYVYSAGTGCYFVFALLILLVLQMKVVQFPYLVCLLMFCFNVRYIR